MNKLITNCSIQPGLKTLHIVWGIAVYKDQWPWPDLKLRVYCRPFPQLGQPHLLSPGRDVRPNSNPGAHSYNPPDSPLVAEPAAASPLGHYYPVTIPLHKANPPDADGVCYMALEWPVLDRWPDNVLALLVQFGRIEHDVFVSLHETALDYALTGDPVASAHLPSVESVPEAKRVRRRGANKRLFISYSHQDEASVIPIAKMLNDKFYYDVWIDYDSLPGGARWKDEIARGIVTADIVLFMLSVAAVNSPWCQEEIRLAQTNDKHIIPIRIDATVTETELAQIGLENIQYIDFVGSSQELETLRTAFDQGRFDFGTTPMPQLDKLLTSLPVVLPRNKRWKDEAFIKLHTDYLRSLFRRLGSIDWAYMPPGSSAHDASVLDIYTRLKLRVGFGFQIERGAYADWWLWAPPLEEQKTQHWYDGDDYLKKPKQFAGFAPEDPGLAAWQQQLQADWNARRNTRRRNRKRHFHDYFRVKTPLAAEYGPALQARLIITGEPGSGKTIFIRFLALCMAGDQLYDATEAVEKRADLDLLSFWPHPAFTPVYINLKDYVNSVLADPARDVSAREFLDYLRDHQLQPAGCEAYYDALVDQMRDGSVMFFLDGLDEVPNAANPQRRKQIASLVNLLCESYPQCRIVMTRRTKSHFTHETFKGFGEVELRPMTDEQLADLATRLFGLAFHDSQVEHTLKRFDAEWRAVPRELHTNPLHFTMLATIWSQDKTLPQNGDINRTRRAIYRRIVDILIQRWAHKDGQTNQSLLDQIGLLPDQLQDVLRQLAYKVHRDQPADDPIAYFTAGNIVDLLYDLNLEQADLNKLLDTLSKRTGIISEDEKNKFLFARRSFQIELASRHLTAHLALSRESVDMFRADPLRWQRVFELMIDEVAREPATLWHFVGELLHCDGASLPSDPNDTYWHCSLFAARIVRDHLWGDESFSASFMRAHILTVLAALVECGALKTEERVEMGLLLADLGDPRPGVLAHDGVPAISWAGPVPGGVCSMGGVPSDLGESLLTEIDLPDPFWIARYPVTADQFRAFAESDAYHDRAFWTAAGWAWQKSRVTQPPDDESYRRNQRANQPVIGVSWYEAHAFTRWLEHLRQQGQLQMPPGVPADYVIRLPRECEWEKAARYPDGRFYPWGNTFDENLLNWGRSTIKTVIPVGLFPRGTSAEFNISDLVGNVWEWQLTEWRFAYTTPDQENNAVDGDLIRTLRGGSFHSTELESIHNMSRRHGNPGSTRLDHGFRLIVGPRITT